MGIEPEPVLAQNSMPLLLPLKVSDNSYSQPDPGHVVQVHPLLDRLLLAPLCVYMTLYPDPLLLLTHGPAVPHAETMESWGYVFPILIVIKNNPAIEFFNLREKVLVVPGWWAVVHKPSELGRIQNGRNDKLILHTRMVTILFVHCFFEMYKHFHNLISGLAPGKIYQASCHQYSHWPWLFFIITHPSIFHLCDGGITDCQPVDVHWVWLHGGAAGGPGCVDVVELVPSHADVDPCVRPGLVDHLNKMM